MQPIRPRLPKPLPARTLLETIFRERRWQRQIARHQVFLFWDEVLDPEIARRTRPAVIRKDVLWVKVSDQVWLHHLHLQKPILLAKLNQRLGTALLSDIRFQLDHNLEVPAPARPRPSLSVLAPPPPLPPDLEAALASLADPELAATIRRTWERAARRSSRPSDG